MRSDIHALFASAALVLGGLGCASRPPPASKAPPRVAPQALVSARAAAAADPLSTPPPAGPLPAVRFPAIGHVPLDNGMELRFVPREGEPLVELRLVVFSGSATDGDRPGVSELAGELLKEGGAAGFSAETLVERAESLGAHLEITTGEDATSVALRVATPDFEAALDLIADVVLRPQFSPIEFGKLRAREIEHVKNAERGDADWAAVTLLYRRLFPEPSHPYAHYQATAGELETVSLADCRKWYARFFVPQNALLVVAGDVDAPAMALRAKHAFESWRGGAAPVPVFPASAPRLGRRVWVVDRPHAGQSEIYVAALGPERSSSTWPALAASNQILGGGVASRLFADVREKRSLAYHTSSSLDDVAHGPVPLVLSAGTRTSNTRAALEALLENLKRMAEAPPSAWEVAMAQRSLTNRLLFRTERVGDLAELAARLAILHLSDDYFQVFQRNLEQLDAGAIFTTTRSYYDVENPVVVVAGDAAAMAGTLRSFGNVEVVDPERDFGMIRELSQE